MRGGRLAAAVVGCLGLVAAGAAAAAGGGNSGAADPALLLGAIATYATPDAARQACGADPVVWADRYEGFFYAPAEAKYGRTGAGAYACRAEARRGNYWDTSPLSSMAGHPSKSFPFTPTFVGS